MDFQLTGYPWCTLNNVLREFEYLKNKLTSFRSSIPNSETLPIFCFFFITLHTVNIVNLVYSV